MKNFSSTTLMAVLAACFIFAPSLKGSKKSHNQWNPSNNNNNKNRQFLKKFQKQQQKSFENHEKFMWKKVYRSIKNFLKNQQSQINNHKFLETFKIFLGLIVGTLGLREMDLHNLLEKLFLLPITTLAHLITMFLKFPKEKLTFLIKGLLQLSKQDFVTTIKLLLSLPKLISQELKNGVKNIRIPFKISSFSSIIFLCLPEGISEFCRQNSKYVWHCKKLLNGCLFQVTEIDPFLQCSRVVLQISNETCHPSYCDAFTAPLDCKEYHNYTKNKPDLNFLYFLSKNDPKFFNSLLPNNNNDIYHVTFFMFIFILISLKAIDYENFRKKKRNGF